MMTCSNMSNCIKNIACAMSGGVDSCVAALILKKQGFNVLGIFMRNWDIADETGFCQADKEKEDAEYVCRKIGIPFVEVNFVKEYWNYVFSDFIQDYMNGFTPNPDILCNKEIKFNRFYKYARQELQVDAIATGHYARILKTPENTYQLLKAVDDNKDQTFFLSQISQEVLKNCIFPIGSLPKAIVKKIAIKEDFSAIASKKESTGICFIGKRKFKEFIDDYIEPKPGNFVDVENGQIVGQHKGIHNFTVGQRCMIGGHSCAYYAVEKNTETREIFVAPGSYHPALFSQTVFTNPPHWITPQPPTLYVDRAFECDFRFQHRDRLIKCLIYLTEEGNLHIFLQVPLKALTSGQYAVFYRGEECLGSARILTAGPCLYKVNNAELLQERN